MGSRATRSTIFIISGILASFVLAALSWLRLQSMEKAMGGIAPPEFLLTGYGLPHIERMQSALTGELQESYAAVHYVWDMLFPIVFAATLMLLIVQVGADKKWKWLLLAVPAIYAVVDIAENILLEAVFAAEPITAELVAAASTFTVLKAILFAACFLVALVVLLIRPKPEASR